MKFQVNCFASKKRIVHSRCPPYHGFTMTFPITATSAILADETLSEMRVSQSNLKSAFHPGVDQSGDDQRWDAVAARNAARASFVSGVVSRGTKPSASQAKNAG